MGWLSDLLKNLTLSRSAAGALFVATLLLVVLPRRFPLVFQPVPNQWAWLVVGLCIFSCALLVFWLVQAAVSAMRHLPALARSAIPQQPSTDLEATILCIIGLKDPNGVLNLDELNHQYISKLEFLQACKALERKGLVEFNPFSSDLVGLTNSGRSRALELIKRAKV